MRRTILLLAIAGAAFAASFEVSTVKPSAPTSFSCRYLQETTLELSMQGCTLRDYVTSAWGLGSFAQALPSNAAWISSARWDIAAKSSAPVPLPELKRMLQPVLQNRFQLKFHYEMRDLPVFYLSPLKSGLKLSATKPGSCRAWDKKSQPPPPDLKQTPLCDNFLFPGTSDRLGTGIEGTGIPMASFIALLEGLMERPVIDKTGYTGIFDVHLKFTNESVPRFARPPRPGEPPSSQEPTGLPSIFTAIKALGISMDAGKGPVDVFVIGSAQRPSEN